jgi:hypothetical protein
MAVLEQDDALLRLLALEDRADLWNRTILGEEIWPMLRLPRFRREMDGGDAAAQLTSEALPKRTLQNVKSALVSAKNLLSQGPIAQPHRDIWVLSWSRYRRGVDASGENQCLFAENLREQLGDRLLFLEFNNAGLPDQQREDLVFVDLPQRLSLWAARAGGELLSRLPGMTSPWGDEFPSALLYDRALYARMMRALVRRWVAKSRPLAVFVIYGYGLWQPAQQVIREAGIPLIELQHGVIYNNHIGYSLGREGASLPSSAPDHLVVYGRTFGEYLERSSEHWDGRWTVGGHPWLLRSLDDSVPRRKRVVLFSQFIPEIQQAIDEAAVVLARELPSDWEVLLKPHPGEVRTEEVFAKARAAGAKLLGRSDDTYALLPTAAATVCVHSTVAMEALAAGCRSAVLPWSPRPEYLSSLIEAGLIHAVAESADLVSWCQQESDSDNSDVARDLFGKGEEPLDYLQLIERVAAQ